MDTKSLLRGVTDDDSLDALMDNAAAVRAVLDVLGKRLGLPRLDTPPRGSAVVGMTADVVVKMMAPHDRAHSDAEQACLTALDGALPIPTPTLLDKGELEGWSWIVMSRLRGDELVDIWPHLTGADRLSLATQLGECLGILHRLDAPTELERVDWDDWCATRIPRIEADQRKRGCPEALLQGLEILVREADTTAQRTGWLHTEVMLEHLLVEATPSGPRLSGLFDFEPSWVGPVD